MMFSNNGDSFGEVFGRIAGARKKPVHIGKQIVTDKRGRKWLVSTVELVIDHHNGDHETMVFPTTSDSTDDEPTSWGELRCDRYWGSADAKAGHEKVCAEMKDYDEDYEVQA